MALFHPHGWGAPLPGAAQARVRVSSKDRATNGNADLPKDGHHFLPKAPD